MPFIFVTFATFQFEMSALKVRIPENTPLMSVTNDTSHVPIAPFGPAEQTPSADTFTQVRVAVTRAFLSFGVNTAEEGTGDKVTTTTMAARLGLLNRLFSF